MVHGACKVPCLCFSCNRVGIDIFFANFVVFAKIWKHVHGDNKGYARGVISCIYFRAIVHRVWIFKCLFFNFLAITIGVIMVPSVKFGFTYQLWRNQCTGCENDAIFGLQFNDGAICKLYDTVCNVLHFRICLHAKRKIVSNASSGHFDVYCSQTTFVTIAVCNTIPHHMVFLVDVGACRMLKKPGLLYRHIDAVGQVFRSPWCIHGTIDVLLAANH